MTQTTWHQFCSTVMTSVQFYKLMKLRACVFVSDSFTDNSQSDCGDERCFLQSSSQQTQLRKVTNTGCAKEWTVSESL